MSYIKIPYLKGLKHPNILVVGESYYSDHELYRKNPDKLPQRVRNDWLDGTSDITYFNYMDEFLRDYGIANSLEDITFYNYFQKVMNHKDENPDKKIIKNSGIAFFEVIKELKPDAIVFFSIAAYNAVPYGLEGFDIQYLKDRGNKVYPFKQNKNRNDNAYLSYYKHGRKEIPLLAFPHLTRKYSVMKVKENLQNEIIKEVIEVSKVQNILKNQDR